MCDALLVNEKAKSTTSPFPAPPLAPSFPLVPPSPLAPPSPLSLLPLPTPYSLSSFLTPSPLSFLPLPSSPLTLSAPSSPPVGRRLGFCVISPGDIYRGKGSLMSPCDCSR